MTNTIRIPYCWRWWTRLLALVFAVAWSWFVWKYPDHNIGVWIARIFGLFVIMVAAVTGETVIHPHRREVRRVWKFFGVVPIFVRTFMFGAFREVRWRRRWMESEVDSDHWVELVLKNGRALTLTTFLSHERDRSCGDANAMALQIADCLGLPLMKMPDSVEV